MELNNYADLFFTEAREHLARMNAELATLESDVATRQSTDGRQNDSTSESIASIFRAVHTIKGMAAAMQYSSVVESAHDTEAELDQLRERGSLSPLIVTRLAHNADLLARSIDAEYASYHAKSANNAAHNSKPASAFRSRSSDGTRRVRVGAAQLDALMDLTGELEIARSQLEQKVQSINDPSLTQMVAKVSRSINELRNQVMSVQMIGVTQIFEQFPRLVRETARALGKSVDFRIDSGEIEIDRSMLDALADPIIHLLRNAVDHGIEASDIRVRAGKPASGVVTLSAARDADRIMIRVADDGNGVDRERVLARAHSNGIVAKSVSVLSDDQLMDVLVSAGFSTAQHVTEVSGRGVGLDVVETSVRSLGGSLSIESVHGKGTTITMRLPLSSAIVHGLLVRIRDETFILPVANVVEVTESVSTMMEDLLSGETRAARASAVTVESHGARKLEQINLRELMGAPPHTGTTRSVTVDIHGRRIALIVDDVVGHQEIVVKRFARPRGALPLFSGATILGDGAPALIVDVNSLVREYNRNDR